MTHLDYHLITNIWLTSVMVMPTAQTPKDRSTAAVRMVIREMEINAMVAYNHTVCLQIALVAQVLECVCMDKNMQSWKII